MTQPSASAAMPDLTDDQIRKMAKARVGFKVHAMVYVLVNVFLMLVWAFSGGMDGMHTDTGWGGSSYWPMWTHLGWGLGLAIHGFVVYGPGSDMLEREERRIRERMGRR